MRDELRGERRIKRERRQQVEDSFSVFVFLLSYILLSSFFQLEDVPIPSSSHQQPSVWELDHEFFLTSHVEVKREVGQVKEEQIKPTRKILASIMQEYQQSQRVQKSTVGSQLQKYEQTKDDEYKCGLCGYRSELRGKLEAHWESGCNYSNLEKKHNDLIGFQCAACGFRDQSKTQIQLHFSVCQKLYAIS